GDQRRVREPLPHTPQDEPPAPRVLEAARADLLEQKPRLASAERAVHEEPPVAGGEHLADDRGRRVEVTAAVGLRAANGGQFVGPPCSAGSSPRTYFTGGRPSLPRKSSGRSNPSNRQRRSQHCTRSAASRGSP